MWAYCTYITYVGYILIYLFTNHHHFWCCILFFISNTSSFIFAFFFFVLHTYKMEKNIFIEIQYILFVFYKLTRPPHFILLLTDILDRNRKVDAELSVRPPSWKWNHTLQTSCIYISNHIHFSPASPSLPSQKKKGKTIIQNGSTCHTH